MIPSHPSLPTQIFIGLLAGVLCGILFGEWCSVFQPFGMAFVKIMQITVLPFLVVSIVFGVGHLKESGAKSVLKAFAQALLLLCSIGIVLILSIQFAFPDFPRSSLFSSRDPILPDRVDFIDLFIPSNFFHSLSEGFIPAIVIFCLLLGFALIGDRENKLLLRLLNGLSSALFRVSGILAKVIPLGVFAVAANTAGTISLEGLLDIQVFFCSLAVYSLMLMLLVLPLTVSCFTTFSFSKVLASASEALILGISTGNVLITLPLIQEGVDDLYRSIGRDKDAKLLSGVLIPMAFAFPSLGSLSPFLFILFVAWYYQYPFGMWEQLKLVVLGLPSFFSTPSVSTLFLLDYFRLPLDSFRLYIVSQTFHIYFVSGLACMSIFSLTAISAAFITGCYKFQFAKALKAFLLVAIVLAVSIFSLNIFFTHLVSGSASGQAIERIELPDNAEGRPWSDVVSATVHKGAFGNAEKTHPAKDLAKMLASTGDAIRGGTLERISKRNILRVGYNPNAMPFSYFNSKGSLVGFDVQMAYELADFMNVSKLEFIPVDYEYMAEFLNNGTCDVVMAGARVTSNRLRDMRFTVPYLETHLALVVPDGRREEFQDISRLKEMKDLRIAFSGEKKDTVKSLARMLPNATFVEIKDNKLFFALNHADAANDANVLLAAAEKASALCLLYPRYDVAVLNPDNLYMFIYAYPLSKDSDEEVLNFLNYWVTMEKDSGSIQKKYDYWVLGKTAKDDYPRWSVVRNVLHWDI